MKLMNLLDEEYTKHPFYGSPKLTAWLKSKGHNVNIKRVKRLMNIMGIIAIYPTKNTSQKNFYHTIYPYLLADLIINKANLVWCADITYIKLKKGFMYLIAIMDWYSRYVLAWELSNSLEVDFCIEALLRALKITMPEIFNTDQGSQFTSHDFTKVLLEAKIKISMDGKGRTFDNIFIERLWRSVKYENIYLNQYETVQDLRNGLTNYFEFYNNERLHQSSGYKPPYDIYMHSSN